jgi:transcriptional regulator with XRE-family HTH domain
MLSLTEIGKQVATERKRRHLTQKALGEMAQVSRATMDLLENGRATDIGYSKLVRILAGLELELRLTPVVSRRPTLDEILKERAGHD